MISPWIRRRANAVARRAVLALQTHYLTLLSAAVLVGLAYAALTSDEFQTPSRASSAQSETPNATAIGDGGLAQIQSLVWSPPQADMTLRAILYYIVESEEQRSAMQTALVSLNRGRFNAGPVNVEEWIYFVRVATPEEEVAAQTIITGAAREAEALGYKFQVTDLRQASPQN